MNNSTDALVQLWNMCVTSQGSCPEQGLQWDTLRRVMEGLPVARCEALKTNSVDEILSYHFGPHAAGGVLNYVNFTLFWHGMEAILQTAGVFNHRGFDDGTLQVIASLRHFRDAVLELPGAFGGSLDEQPLAECHVRELRILYDQLHDQGLLSGSGAVAEYWADKLRQLPKDEENLMVSADEISAALLQWLEDLLGYAEGSEDASSEEPEQELTPEVFAARSLLKKPEGQDARRATGATGRLSWLLKPDVAENVEVAKFRSSLREVFPHDDISLRDFYRGVREAIPESAAGSSDSRSGGQALRAGVALLQNLVRRKVRLAVSRMLPQRQAPARKPRYSRLDSGLRAARPGTPRSEACGVIAGLVCSQAVAAKVLDRRAHLAPRAFCAAWILERARRRWLVNVVTIWRSRLKEQSLPGKDFKAGAGRAGRAGAGSERSKTPTRSTQSGTFPL